MQLSPTRNATFSPKIIQIALLFLVVCGIYLSNVPDFWRTQDEKCYIWLAENILQGKGLTIELPSDVDRDFLWGMPPVVVGDNLFTIKYPVGQSCLLAATIGVGGRTFGFYIVPILGLLTALCLSLSTYVISRSLRLSLLTGAVLAMCPTWLIHSRSLLGDVPATATIYAALLLCLLGLKTRRHYLHFIAGIFLASGMTIRYPTVLAALPISLLLLSTGRPRERILNTMLLGIPCVAAMILILSFNQHLFGNPFTTGYAAIGEHGFKAEGAVENLLNYLAMSCILLPGAGLALLWYAVRPTELIERRHLATFLLLPILFVVFYSAWGNSAQLTYKPQDLLVMGARLVLPAVPALSLLVSLAVIEICRRFGLPGRIVWALPICLLVASLSVRHVFEQRTREYAVANEFLNSTTSPPCLVILKPHWFKITWPHDGDVNYLALNGHHVSQSQYALIARYHQVDQPVYVVVDPYVRLGLPDPSWQKDSLVNDLRLNGFTTVRRASVHSPFEIELYEVKPKTRTMGL